MLGQIRQPDRFGLSNHEAKDAMATRRRADSGRQLGVDAVGREVLERPPVRRENTNGRVARPDDFCSHLHRPLKHTVEGDLGDERRGGRHELLEALLCGWKLHDGWQRHAERYFKTTAGHS